MSESLLTETANEVAAPAETSAAPKEVSTTTPSESTTSTEQVPTSSLLGDEEKSETPPGETPLIEEPKEGEEIEPEFDLETIEIEGVAIDKSVLKELKDATSALGIKFSKEQAEALVKIQANHVKKLNNELDEQVSKMKEQWKNDYVNDAIARNVNHKEELGLAKKAMKQFGSTELLSDLNDSGMGNNKNIIQFMAKVGKLVSEDSMDFGKAVVSNNLTRAERLFK